MYGALYHAVRFVLYVTLYHAVRFVLYVTLYYTVRFVSVLDILERLVLLMGLFGASRLGCPQPLKGG